MYKALARQSPCDNPIPLFYPFQYRQYGKQNSLNSPRMIYSLTITEEE
ncbi:hypothetical protein [Brevibacillus laterosporus]|nr:hypothetical protein [Brevibacillus laterosporus]